jgi:hypothetical protein
MLRRDRVPTQPRARVALAPRERSVVCALALGAALSVVSFTHEAHADASELPPEIGYNYGEIETPRSLALGGGLRATGNGATALFENPANMALTRIYHVAAFAQIWPQASRQSYGAAAVDSIVSSTGLAGGIGGTWNQQDPDGVDRQYNDIRFALAMPFANTLYVGLGGRLLSLSEDGNGPLGASRASGGLENERIVQTFTFDAGATLRPMPGLALSVVGKNLTDTGLGYMPIMLGGGIGYGTKDFNLEGDAVMDATTWDETTVRINGGAEVLLGDHVGLRAGYRWDQGAESHAVSGGIAYVDPRFSVDGSVRQTVSGDSATAIVFGFTLHIEASGLGATQSTDF